MLYFSTNFYSENNNNKYQIAMNTPTSLYIFQYEDIYLLVNPIHDHTLQNDRLRLGSFFRTNFKIQTNSKITLEAYNGKINKALLIIIKGENNNTFKILENIKYVKKGQIIDNIKILDIKDENNNFGHNNFFEVTKETRLYFKNDTIKLIGLEEQEKELEKIIYIPLLHKNEMLKYHLYINNSFILHGDKGMYKTKFIKKVAQNIHVNIYEYDFLNCESNFFNSFIKKMAELRPCIVIFKNFVSKNIEIIQALKKIFESENSNESNYGIVFVFVTNSLEQKNSIMAKITIDTVFNLKSPNYENTIKIIKNLIRKIPNNLTKKEIEEISEILKGKTIKEIENIFKTLLNNKIYNSLKGDSKDMTIKFKNIKEQRFDYRTIVENTDNPSEYKDINTKLEKMNIREEIFITYDDIIKLINKNILTYTENIIQKTKKTFDDIGGYDEIKQTLKEAVIWPIKHKDVYSKFDIKPVKGIILFGPPGCSKTLFAKALSNESKMTFINIKGSELESKFVGDTDKEIRKLFNKARNNAPSIIFIDEIDSIAQKSDSMNEHHSKTLAAFLTEMDGLEEINNVIVIGTTNRIDKIDPAFMRSGRIDKKIEVGLPDEETRKKIFEIKLKRKMDYNKFIKLTEGMSGADITLICQEVNMIVIRKIIMGQENKILEITEDDIIEAIEKIKLNL